MNFKKHWLKMALLFATAAVIAFVIPTTIAYIVKESNTVINLFDADYIAPDEGGVDVMIQKIVTSMGEETIPPEGFQFYLVNQDDPTENYTLTADSQGQAGMRLFFADQDVGKEFHYQLSEINDGKENVTYSDIVYDIRIVPEINTDNQVSPSIYIGDVSADAISVQFENIYAPQPEPPETGDTAPLFFFAGLLLISGLGVIILMKKRRAMN